jgi:hypothetical protein
LKLVWHIEFQARLGYSETFPDTKKTHKKTKTKKQRNKQKLGMVVCAYNPSYWFIISATQEAETERTVS